MWHADVGSQTQICMKYIIYRSKVMSYEMYLLELARQ